MRVNSLCWSHSHSIRSNPTINHTSMLNPPPSQIRENTPDQGINQGSSICRAARSNPGSRVAAARRGRWRQFCFEIYASVNARKPRNNVRLAYRLLKCFAFDETKNVSQICFSFGEKRTATCTAPTAPESCDGGNTCSGKQQFG